MELEQAIKGRRSIRSFTEKPVPTELVRRVLEAGTWASSAKNGQQWRFTVLTGSAKDELLDVMQSELEVKSREFGVSAMGSTLSSCRIMRQAPVLVMVWNAGGAFRGDRVAEAIRRIEVMISNARELGHKAETQGVSAAIQNMLLMAHGLGLGSLWINDIYYALEALENTWISLGSSWLLSHTAGPRTKKGTRPSLKRCQWTRSQILLSELN